MASVFICEISGSVVAVVQKNVLFDQTCCNSFSQVGTGLMIEDCQLHNVKSLENSSGPSKWNYFVIDLKKMGNFYFAFLKFIFEDLEQWLNAKSSKTPWLCWYSFCSGNLMWHVKKQVCCDL